MHRYPQAIVIDASRARVQVGSKTSFDEVQEVVTHPARECKLGVELALQALAEIRRIPRESASWEHVLPHQVRVTLDASRARVQVGSIEFVR